jgi:O-antigen ligase
MKSDRAIPKSVWITRFALGLAVTLVVARASMTQQLRDPFEVQPGKIINAPRGVGAAGSVLLDLLMCLPAVLVLIRSSIDRHYLISFSRVHLLGFALAAWIVFSTFWASDRFAAAVEATHWGAAIVLLWAVSQLVDSWTRLRSIAAVCFGTLLVLTAHGAVYRFVDVPDQRKSFVENESKIYEQNGWTPDSFIARQFKKKVMSGEIIGFSASPNTYAMMLVLLGLVAVGLAAQRISNRDEWGWSTVILLTIPVSLAMLWITQCRAALATPVIGLCLFLAAAASWAEIRTLPHTWLVAMHRRTYWIGVFIILLGVAAVVGQGLLRGSLIHDSLTFRWRYWIGAERIFVQHWLSGVGFANFGNYYLSVRLPVASEEIKDPHNFFVRIAVETGSIGAILLVAWMMRLWWEMTAPQTVEGDHLLRAPRLSSGLLESALALAVGSMLINTLASVDFSQSTPWIIIELLKRTLWLALLFVGLVIGTMRATNRQVYDDRPAPWILWAILASLGVFLLHNTIEFGLFESGPLGMFVLLAGSVLGVRGVNIPPNRSDPNSPDYRDSLFGATWWLSIIAIILWLTMAAFWVRPMMYTEGQALAGDDDLQNNRFAAAEQEYYNALWGLPLRNADYAMKLAITRAYAGDPPSQVIDALDAAVAADPTYIKGYLNRAQFWMQMPQPSLQKVKNDYQTAIDLNPNDVDVRTEYAAALEHLGLKLEAAQAYRAALEKNDGLSPDEPKRLTHQQVQSLRNKIATLEAE